MKRNIRIDILRILSMYMVTVLHVLGQGGILSAAAKVKDGRWMTAWFLEIACYGAADLFALISGYVGVNGHPGPKKLLALWCRVLFYTLGITACFALFSKAEITREHWLAAFFPIMHKQYWYMTAYFALYLLMPVLNAGILSLSQKTCQLVVLSSVFLYMLLPTVFSVSVFGLSGGYSFAWLVICYCIGGILRGHGELFRRRLPAVLFLLLYVLLTFVTWFGKVSGKYDFVGYTSPAVFLSAVFLLLAFAARTNIPISPASDAKEKVSGKSRKIVSYAGPASLAVYLIHVHPLIWENVMKGSSKPLASLSPWLLVPAVLFFAGAIYAVTTLIELLRATVSAKIRSWSCR